MERTPRNCFRCRSDDHFIEIFIKAPKDNEKQRKQIRFNERSFRASQKECDNSENNNDQKIYASMARMSDNDEYRSRNFDDISQLTNWILDSGATCHMITAVLSFIPGLLDNIDKHIEVADGIILWQNENGK